MAAERPFGTRPRCDARIVRERLIRLGQLWRLYASMDFAWMAQDFRFFLMCWVSDAISALATIAAALLLSERFDGIGPWTKPQVAFMLGYATLVSGVTSSVFSYNVLHISRRVGRGQFDHTLLQPQPVWLSLLTEGFSPFSGGSGVLAAGVGLLVWAGRDLRLAASPGWLAAAALNLVASAAILVAFGFLWGSVAFWAPRAAEEISSAALRLLRELAPFPLEPVGSALRYALTAFLPAGLIAWHPSRSLLDPASPAWSKAFTPVAASLLAALAIAVFRKGMKQYERTGSQRYRDFGHRR